MKKQYTIMIAVILIIIFAVSIRYGPEKTTKGNMYTQNMYTQKDITFPQGYDLITNKIPSWVEKDKSQHTLYVFSFAERDAFDHYAKEVFLNISDPDWTAEQNSSVYLGQGIPCFVLSEHEIKSDVVYYPIILNHTIVSMLMVIRDKETGTFQEQLAPYFVNELNHLCDKTSRQYPLLLCESNSNIIGIIDKNYYMLRDNHMRDYGVEIEDSKVQNLKSVEIVEIYSILSDRK